jgi:hypothetical protein
MYGEKRQELAGPLRFPEAGRGMRLEITKGNVSRKRMYAEVPSPSPYAGKPIQQKEGRLKTARESDSLIVL